MTYTFDIPQKLPALNDYINAERTHRQVGARLRRETEYAIAWDIRRQLPPGLHIEKPVRLHYTWTEPNMKRDHDNVAAAQKFVQDALVDTGVLSGDGWKQVYGFTHKFICDRTGGYNCRVEIEEVD